MVIGEQAGFVPIHKSTLYLIILDPLLPGSCQLIVILLEDCDAIIGTLGASGAVAAKNEPIPD